VPAAVEEDVPQAARVAEAALLRLPFRGHAQPAIGPVDADGGVVGRLDDGHLAGLAVRHPPEAHADAVPAVGDEPHGANRLIVHRVRDALVHRHHQVRRLAAGGRLSLGGEGVGRERMGEPERRVEIGVGLDRENELRRLFVQGDCARALEPRFGVEPVEGDPPAVGRRLDDHERACPGVLGPLPAARLLDDPACIASTRPSRAMLKESNQTVAGPLPMSRGTMAVAPNGTTNRDRSVRQPSVARTVRPP